MSPRPARLRARALLAAAGGFVAIIGTLAMSQSPSRPRASAANGYCVKLQPALHGFVHFTNADPQTPADCAGWQNFVYLNWRAKANAIGEPAAVPPTDFGRPVDDPAKAETTVWESYHDASELFSSDLPMKVLRGRAGDPHLTLGAINKYMNHELIEATGQATGGWITAQNRLLTFYDIRVDNDEYEYVRENGLFTGAALRACAQGKVGFQLPLGSGLDVPRDPAASPGPPDVSCTGPLPNPKRPWYGKGIGAIDIKAAWLDLTGAPKSVLRRYLIQRASLQYPGEANPRPNRTIGLVGIHIVRKMTGAHQWLWATFQHRDNMPSGWISPLPTPRPGATWAYFNPKSAKPPNSPIPVACPTAGCTAYDMPSQLVAAVGPPRDTSLINPLVWKMLPASSVFQNYELVSVQWTHDDTPLPPGAPIPLTSNSPVPKILGNPVLESYRQTTSSCLQCHRFGALPAPSSSPLAAGVRRHRLVLLTAPPTSGPVPYGADYSFVFGDVTK